MVPCAGGYDDVRAASSLTGIPVSGGLFLLVAQLHWTFRSLGLFHFTQW